MAHGRSLRLSPEWDHRFTRMVGVSAVGHVVALVALVFFATRSPPPPLPLVAYTVEITDPSALGGRLPPGTPGKDLSGGATKPAPPEPPASAAEAAQKAELPQQVAKTPPVEPAPEPPQPTPTVPEVPKPPPQPPPTVATKQPEPAPVVDKKAEPPKPEPPKTTPSTVPPKAEAAPPKPSPKPEAKAEAKTPPKPAEPPKAAAKPEARPPSGQAAAGATGAGNEAPVKDAYAAAAERWRSHAGGGLGGEQEGSGPVGSGGDGKGGGGQLVGVEFLSYRQRVIDTIKSHWTNVILRPGLVASVRFEIAPDGEVSDIRLAQSSNNAAYDASVMRAVQQVEQLPPPPSRYVNDFRDFQIEFHSEETGGRREG